MMESLKQRVTVRSSFLLAASLYLQTVFAPIAQAEVRVVDFSPQGEVKVINQATAVFSDDMVKLGATDAAAPFVVTCPVKGAGRWSDTKTWKYRLVRDLQSGERCNFTLKANLKALNNDAVADAGTKTTHYAQAKFEFYTAGPWITDISPTPNAKIEEDQHFFVRTSAPVKPSSVEKNVWCEVEGVGERISVNLMTKAAVEAAASALPDEGISNALGLSCKQRLPAGAKVKLVWGKGVMSETGGVTLESEDKNYEVRLPFRAELTCEREKSTAPCSALSDLTLKLSDQISLAMAEKIQLVSKNATLNPRDVSPERKLQLLALNPRLFYLKNVQVNKDHLDTVVFKGPFNPNTDFTIQLPKGFVDLSGRSLSNAKRFPLKTKVGALPPLAKFAADFGILERSEGGVLPVTLRNTEAKVRMRVLHKDNVSDMVAVTDALRTFESQTKEIALKPEKMKQRSLEGYEEQEYQSRVDTLYPRELSFLENQSLESTALPVVSRQHPFEVIGIPLKKPGFYVVEIESKMLGNALLSEPKPMYVRSTALVTDMAVHFKKGRDNSLIWVTSLITGKPLANVNVQVHDCHGASFWQGKTDTQGRAMVAQELPNNISNCGDLYYASAQFKDDFSYAQSDWTRGIEPWRFNVNTWSELDSPKIHTILDRTMLRAGETVSMKHIARVPNYKGYQYPAAGSLPSMLTLELVGGEFSLELPLEWDERGVATSSWKIPQDAKTGSYSIKIGASWRAAAEFRVSEFRLPAFKGAVAPAKSRYANVKEIPLNLSLAYLNGGGASGQEVQVSALLKRAYLNFSSYSEFSFGEYHERDLNELLLDKQTVTLDKLGVGKLSVSFKNALNQPASMQTEMTFTDPNGEIQTIHGQTEIWPANIALGLQVKDWAGLHGKHKLQAVALNLEGKPQAGVNVVIEGSRSWEFVHRKRVIGGFYSYEVEKKNVDLGKLCEGKTNAQGFFDCQVEAKESGEIELKASVKDNAGNIATASSGFWTSDDGDVWFGQSDEDRMEVIAEKREYSPGDKARFQVHSPFYSATALISVEREGILQTYVQTLNRRDAVVEIPIGENWGPNVFVSVLAVRGRLTEVPWYSFFQWGWHSPTGWLKAYKEGIPKASALVDLAKPSFKFGMAKIAVSDSGVKLKVAVTADKKTYKPRDKASIKVKVLLPNGKPAPAGSEVAIAAVDKALLELNANHTWDLLTSMQQDRAYLIETASAQMQVVGKRHYGKKALPAGGGGGRLSARELFNSLLYWNPRVKLDKNSEAKITVPLNDSLTAFKIVAIADVNANLFGTGETEIVSRQDLQMTSGLPPLVREGDSYRAMVMMRNSTESPMQLRVNGRTGNQDLGSQSISLQAGESKELAWQIKVPDDVDNLPWQIEALDAKGKMQDRIRFTQKVQPRTPVTVQQANFMRLGEPSTQGKYTVPTGLPAGAIAGKGGVDVRLSAKLADQTAGIERYFNEYPYSCLEQKTSIATGLSDKARWADIMANLSSYQDAQGFLSYFPGAQYGSEALTAYVMTMAYENGVKLPAEVEAGMQTALLDYAEGRTQSPSPWYWGENRYLKERKLNALAALSYSGNVEPRMLEAFEFKPIQMPTTTLIDWYTILKHLKQPDTARMALLERELRNRLQNVSGRLVFSTEANDYWWWAMVDGEVNATRLVSLLMDDPAWQKDMPALLRGALMRQNKGRWHTTLSNAWGRVALDKFGQQFEREAVTGKTTAKLDAIEQTYTWPQAAKKADKPQTNIGQNQADASLYMPWSKAATQQLSLAHIGTGKPWVNLIVTVAVPSLPKENGFKLTRTVTAIEQKVVGKWSRGDLVRVRIDVDSDQSMSWVALSDPIPGGASILGNTARDSAIAQEGENEYAGDNHAYPNYTERGLGFFRAYYEYVPKGHFWYEYTIRLNNPGTFNMPPTRVEAMYAPEIFGQLPNASLVVDVAK